MTRPNYTSSTPQSSGNGPDGAHPPITRSPMAQERGFMSNVQRNQSGSQFASPQSGTPMSPHPSPGGPLYPGMGPYSQSAATGSYGPQGSQYGHQEFVEGLTAGIKKQWDSLNIHETPEPWMDLLALLMI
ncbi:unnamed protein product [Menidia menidia]|uniref:(Atlantic silverside) hypothetical protein n=1 Tax=Menidia menidia TaxID=238744 RepID=A0A8S4AJ32_9TELE|nr:unnamed protein product [Menidia menidia]